ncbi:MAG: hypothetical protein JNK89_00375 [Saprospiraceae bacterium]|nr:hypothetical protein [Saprospiraceae bacterium]
MIRLLVLIPLATLAFCKTGQKTVADQAPFVELRTGGCFGYCPMFRLTVRNNGRVEYEGFNFAERPGLDSFQLRADELRMLKEKVGQVNLWQYPDQIKSDVVDAPSATLTVFKDGQSKSVLGSIDRPAPLLQLEDLLKDLAEAHDFQVRRGVNPNEPPPGSRREVIVLLKPEVNAGNWIRQFTEFKFLLVRRVSEANMWIVAYDPKQLDEASVLALFKDQPDVLEVQTNQAAPDRE